MPQRMTYRQPGFNLFTSDSVVSLYHCTYHCIIVHIVVEVVVRLTFGAQIFGGKIIVVSLINCSKLHFMANAHLFLLFIVYSSPTMVVYSKEAVAAFVEFKGKYFPYNCISRDEYGFHCKWLFFSAPSLDLHHVSIERPQRHYVLPACTLSFEKVQELIIEGDAFPLPPPFEHVVDCIDYLSLSLYKDWHTQVYVFFDLLLRRLPMSETRIQEFTFYRQVLHWLVRHLICQKYPIGVGTEVIYMAWTRFYEDQWKEFHVYEFFDLCEKSIDMLYDLFSKIDFYVNEKIVADELDDGDATPFEEYLLRLSWRQWLHIVQCNSTVDNTY